MESKPTPPPDTPTTPPTAPVMDVVAPPPADQSEGVPQAGKRNDPKAEAKQKFDEVAAQKPHAPKQPHTGVGLAIFATIIIVLGLAALATYAYIKTQ